MRVPEAASDLRSPLHSPWGVPHRAPPALAVWSTDGPRPQTSAMGILSPHVVRGCVCATQVGSGRAVNCALALRKRGACSAPLNLRGQTLVLTLALEGVHLA